MNKLIAVISIIVGVIGITAVPHFNIPLFISDLFIILWGAGVLSGAIK